MWIPRKVWNEFVEEHRALRERVDRLTEAVARQQNVSLRMPLPETKPRQPQEKARGWFDQPYNPFSEKSKQ